MIIVSLIAVAVVGVSWYFRYSGPASVDAIVDSWTADIKALEEIAGKKAAEVFHLNDMKTLAQTELDKAEGFAAKLKNIFG